MSIRIVCEDCGGRPSVLCDHDWAADIAEHIGHRVSVIRDNQTPPSYPAAGHYALACGNVTVHGVPLLDFRQFRRRWDWPPALDETWR
jgi:hypothetical protein